MGKEDTAQYWIDTLNLFPHPGLETGFLNEVFRDPHLVKGTAGKPRNAGTNIYFLHKPAPAFDDNTVFFRMKNSELLNFYRGSAIELLFMPDEKSPKIERLKLGPNAENGERYFHSLPRDRWFVRRLESDNPDDFALIGCTVMPGYDPEDIETKTYGEIKAELQ